MLLFYVDMIHAVNDSIFKSICFDLIIATGSLTATAEKTHLSFALPGRSSHMPVKVNKLP